MMREKFEKKALQMAIFQTMANVTAKLAMRDMTFRVSYMTKFRVVKDFLANTAMELREVIVPEKANEATDEQFKKFCEIVEKNSNEFLANFNEQDFAPFSTNELTEEVNKMFLSAPKWVDFIGNQTPIENFSEEIGVDGMLISLVLTEFIQEVMEVEDNFNMSSESSGILH